MINSLGQAVFMQLQPLFVTVKICRKSVKLLVQLSGCALVGGLNSLHTINTYQKPGLLNSLLQPLIFCKCSIKKVDVVFWLKEKNMSGRKGEHFAHGQPSLSASTANLCPSLGKPRFRSAKEVCTGLPQKRTLTSPNPPVRFWKIYFQVFKVFLVPLNQQEWTKRPFPVG